MPRDDESDDAIMMMMMMKRRRMMVVKIMTKDTCKPLVALRQRKVKPS